MSSTTTEFTGQAPPTLIVEVDDKSVAMTVHSISIDVQIAGTMSRTSLVMTFENPHDRDLEGELTFPLPDGAALCGYGLDVDGQIVDASLVQKQKARMVFEEELRKGVDPGLVERVRGNQFRTRIWPLPAHGKRSIRVEYVSALDMRDGNLVYELPLRFEPPQRDVSAKQIQQFAMWGAFFDQSNASIVEPSSDRFRLCVTVAKGGAAPVTWDAEVLGFEEREDAWTAETCRAYSMPETVRIGLPPLQADAVAVERFCDDDFYFHIDAIVVDSSPPTFLSPTKVALVWDASFSRATTDKQKDFDLLRALMKRVGTVDVDVFVLRNDVDEPYSFSVIAGQCDAMLNMLADLPYDGGTSFSDLNLEQRAYDAYLLFSDGVSTLNDDLPTASEIPVYVVSSEVAANRPLLRYVAERSGGAYLDLFREPVEQACDRIFVESLSLLGTQFEKGAIEDVYPVTRSVLQGGVVGVSGRLLKNDAEIILRFGRGNVETERRSIKLSRAAATSTGLIGRHWAQQKIDELTLHADRNGDELLELGRRFHIVTANTSLLVLETLEQHLEHGVVPAASRSEMRKSFDDGMSQRRSQEAGQRKERLDDVGRLWQDRVDWWEKEFDLSSPVQDEPVVNELQGGMIQERTMAAFAPAEPSDIMFHSIFSSSRRRVDDAPALCEVNDLAAETPQNVASIKVSPWDPKTPYLKKLKKVGNDKAYDMYLEQRVTYGRKPSFHLDCADYLFRIGQRKMAIRVLTNVAELDLESPQLLRMAAYKLEMEGEYVLAGRILDQVLVLRPEEPQSYRDLALVLDLQGEFRRAVELLWDVANRDWDGRFPEIETIAIMELNRVLARAQREGQADLAKEVGVDKRFLKLLDQDLRVVLTWDADLTDVDLWVTDPIRERCDYSNNRTRMGGRMSADFTQGYGPEEYVVRKGKSGTYLIQANFYGSSQQTLTGPATLLATVFTNFGRQNEERRAITLRVTEVKEQVELGEVTLETS